MSSRSYKSKIFGSSSNRKADARRKAMRSQITARIRSLPIQGATRSARINAGEVKAADFQWVNLPYDLDGSIVTTNTVTTGAAFWNRIGRKMEMKSLEIVGKTDLGNNIVPISTIVPPQFLRFMVIYDKQPNGVIPVYTDFLTDYSNVGTTTTTSYSGINLNNRDRFIVLRDKKFQTPYFITSNGPSDGVISSEANVDQRNWEPTIKMYIPLKGLTTMFKADTTPPTIGDISTGALYIFIISSAAGPWMFNGRSRLRFYDK